MFTDEKLQELHCDINYKRTNGLTRNMKHSFWIVKNEGGTLSLSISTSPSVSISINLLKFFWGILKYVIITNELIIFRKKVIETVLHQYYSNDFDIIGVAMAASYKWIENSEVKLSLIEKLCVEYLMNVENRVILIKYSNISEEESEKKLLDTIIYIKKIFQEAISECRINQLYQKSYECLLTNPENRECLKKIFSESIHSGNLTSERREE